MIDPRRFTFIAILILGSGLVLSEPLLAGSKPGAAKPGTQAQSGKTSVTLETKVQLAPTATPSSPAKLIQPEALIVSKKKGYLYIVWDVFSHREIFDPKQKNSRLAALRYAAYIAQVHGFLKHPDYPEARVNIIVFNERDEYGGPRWDSVEKYHALTLLAEKYAELKIAGPEQIWTLTEKKLNTLLAAPKGKK